VLVCHRRDLAGLCCAPDICARILRRESERGKASSVVSLFAHWPWPEHKSYLSMLHSPSRVMSGCDRRTAIATANLSMFVVLRPDSCCFTLILALFLDPIGIISLLTLPLTIPIVDGLWSVADLVLGRGGYSNCWRSDW